jgi:preprotein translocase subunit SecF
VKLVRYKLKPFDIVSHRNKFFAFSLAITVIGLITLLVFGLNYGVDFKAGTAVDVSLENKATKSEINESIERAKIEKAEELRIGGDQQDRITLRFAEVLTDKQVYALEKEMRASFGDKTAFEVNVVDPEIARELARSAIIGVIIASIGIVIYTIIRFEWRFAIAAIIALLHDAFIVVSFFSIFQLEVNLPFVAAVLTIIGYSINDTIVIFDRIRENLRFTKKKTFENISILVNDSIWQTMTRSINTVVTVIFAAVALFIFGSESIALFSLAILIGLISGAYSSIFIASPVWLLLKKYTDPKKADAQTPSVTK